MVFSAKSRNSAGTSSFGSTMTPSSSSRQGLPRFRIGVFAVLPRFPSGPRVGCCFGVGRQTFDQCDDFKSSLWCKFQERPEQPQALNGFARWSPELVLQLCNRGRSFHLAPLLGSGNAMQGKREDLAHKGRYSGNGG